ncbi:hypothetical protein CGMCC3_g17072 [Colletotrichum fructicola]|uniref:Uncharacterized protein n=1 Tax=Colletotrichum fructicola (strain Nara gc5) TaxID=1213859 RepID=L2GG87_COLFN|nr:uncharacterized protein CGMCC3_g17072 [Colletotrichum fructicola]KAF4475412.1 hypothetical protein CGGC5_v016014 [Colletotrichum fructicola Nara gc5]KAE9566761.1 hypothetical protein CGMCC3_g17072 [Colletotrichum fructicola]KAF4417847.1 hypothetical protein CFRS1_v015129 [Colletotrichum fructicola]KAF4486869.1 hypothetical protein CGGC5_v005877 [Colletotrichum fructicola Nara gc5]KAF4881026.1 hypothetical protein CGCFRS4_v015969 [Colletotrichum fructicola]
MAAADVITSLPSINEYSHQHFQDLPTLEYAKAKFLGEAKGEEVIATTIKNFFVESGMDRTFGVAMLHRHFDLDPNEKLVEYRGTSTPWAATVPGMEGLHGSVWAFDKDGVLRPTEFRYSGSEDAQLSSAAMEFVDRFKTLLKDLGLIGFLGLSRYPGDDFQGSCEITNGRANINLEPQDYPKDLVHIPTIWYFSTELWQRGCRCTCNGNSEDHGHGVHVYTVSG